MEYALNGKLRKEWSELGGWRKDPNHKYGWSKTKSRKEFVTAYAYSKNPNEDWAESVAYYLFHPNALRSCSLAKYEFIDQVMHMYSEGGVLSKDWNTWKSVDILPLLNDCFVHLIFVVVGRVEHPRNHWRQFKERTRL